MPSRLFLFIAYVLLFHLVVLSSSFYVHTFAEAARQSTSAPMGANARRTAAEDVLSSAILRDPQQDVFSLLSSQDLAQWSFLEEPRDDVGPYVSYTLSPSSSSSTLDEILKRLRAFEDVIYVNVRLVGFDGEGEQGLSLSVVLLLLPPPGHYWHWTRRALTCLAPRCMHSRVRRTSSGSILTCSWPSLVTECP